MDHNITDKFWLCNHKFMNIHTRDGWYMYNVHCAVDTCKINYIHYTVVPLWKGVVHNMMQGHNYINAR